MSVAPTDLQLTADELRRAPLLVSEMRKRGMKYGDLTPKGQDLLRRYQAHLSGVPARLQPAPAGPTFRQDVESIARGVGQSVRHVGQGALDLAVFLTPAAHYRGFREGLNAPRLPNVPQGPSPQAYRVGEVVGGLAPIGGLAQTAGKAVGLLPRTAPGVKAAVQAGRGIGPRITQVVRPAQIGTRTMFRGTSVEELRATAMAGSRLPTTGPGGVGSTPYPQQAFKYAMHPGIGAGKITRPVGAVIEYDGDRFVRGFIVNRWGRVLEEVGPGGTVRTFSIAAKAGAGVARGASLEEQIAGPLRITPTEKVAATPRRLVEPGLKVPLTEKVTTAAENLFTKAGVQRDPNLLISDQLVDLLVDGRLRVDDIDPILRANKIGFEEFATGIFRPTVRRAAQTLQKLSALQAKISRLAESSPEEAARLRDFAGQIDDMARTRGWWQRLGNAWRASLVSQLSTAVRNYVVTVERLGLDTLEQGIEAGLQKATGKVVTSSPLEGLRALGNMFFKPRVTSSQVESILSAFPREGSRMFMRFSADVSTGVGKGIDKATNVITVFGRTQEFFSRKAIFQAHLAEKLSQRGKDLTDIIGRNAADEIDPVDIQSAVNKALDITFASHIDPNSTPGLFVRLVNRAGPLLQAGIPFPRFLIHSGQYFFERSPMGLLKLLSPAQRAAMAAGDMRVISRASVGSMMLGAAWQVRKQYGGEKWYELRVGKKTIDTRPFNPFSSYLFVADAVDRIASGKPFNYTSSDVARAVLGANVASGTGLYLVDQGLDILRNLVTGSTERPVRRIKEFAGQFAAGFLTPLQQLQDVLGQFDHDMRIVRDVEQEPFLGPIKAKIPGVAETLPEAEIPTRAGPYERQAPLLKQTTGVRFVAPKNPAERELDRLGFTRTNILPGTGDPAADRLIAKHMGPLVEQFLARIVNSDMYRKESDAGKAILIAQNLEQIRELARGAAAAEDPARFARLRFRGLPKREQRYLIERGVSP